MAEDSHAADTWTSRPIRNYWVQIHIGGEYATMTQTCAEFSLQNTVCVAMTPVDYVYPGCREKGATIRLINTPSGVASELDVWRTAALLARTLADSESQLTYTLEGPDRTQHFSRKADVMERVDIAQKMMETVHE